ncbi:LPXTG cell wall anchor domain-containing protein [Streptomyces sp. NPDC056600]|uniref:LPXTG cell wall anchor domain-containing protein n=1 Tax=Streptomyces sp. NPDC056600 TaxID=3345874 RepID=UPI0036CAC111
MSHRSLPRWASALPLAATLLLAGAAVPAAATGAENHTEQIHQDLPLTAGGFQNGDCPTVPAGKDGWHFVLPGNDTVFTKLTLTFEPGGEQVITDFGPPSDKHAYAASEPGAKLVAAVAETEGADVKFFNLSHTCPASSAPEQPGEENPGGENPGEENPGGENPGEENPGEENPGGEQPCEEQQGGSGEEQDCQTPPCTGTGDEQDCDEQPGGGTEGGATGQPTEVPTGAEPTQEATAAPAEGDLAETGAGPAVGLAFAAALLLAAGGAIVIRNRRAGAGG